MKPKECVKIRFTKHIRFGSNRTQTHFFYANCLNIHLQRKSVSSFVVVMIKDIGQTNGIQMKFHLTHVHKIIRKFCTGTI